MCKILVNPHNKGEIITLTSIFSQTIMLQNKVLCDVIL